jgi:hypothetical protein
MSDSDLMWAIIAGVTLGLTPMLYRLGFALGVEKPDHENAKEGD